MTPLDEAAKRSAGIGAVRPNDSGSHGMDQGGSGFPGSVCKRRAGCATLRANDRSEFDDAAGTSAAGAAGGCAATAETVVTSESIDANSTTQNNA